MSLNASEHHNPEAVVPPADERQGEKGVRDDLPYAVIQLCFFDQQAEAQCGQEDGHKANRKHLRGLCDDVEHVVWLHKHRLSSEFLELARWAVGEIGFMFFGIFLGTFLGMRIQEIMSCGGAQ